MYKKKKEKKGFIEKKNRYKKCFLSFYLTTRSKGYAFN